MRNGFPTRTRRTPRASNCELIQSMAALLGAHTSTCGSRRVVSTIASTSVVVLPVPGGPCTMATSRALRMRFTARFWLSFRLSNRIGAKSRFSGFIVPMSVSRRCTHFSLSNDCARCKASLITW